MNIILLGYRGTGKSVLGKILSHKLKRRLYRIDGLIVASAGQPIPEIVEQGGWTHFREIESRIVKEVSESAENSIIDCAGGVVLDPENIKNLKRRGKVVLLTASLSTILKRLRGDSRRPSLKPGLTFEEEQKQTNPNRTTYKLNETYDTPLGPAKVIGYDLDGEPILDNEEIRKLSK